MPFDGKHGGTQVHSIGKTQLEAVLKPLQSTLPASWSAVGFSTDTRTLQPGEVFIALRGERFDGHDFVAEAAARGAAAAIVERPLPEPFPQVVVPDTLAALAHIARWYRMQHTGPVIAVAGSAGKTTTKEMIAALLSQRYRVLKSYGNYNNHIGVALTLLQWQPQDEIIVLELGTNHPGEIAALCEIAQPTMGLITLIGPEHLEFFHTVEQVAEEELTLFRYLVKRQGMMVVNADDPFIAAFANQHPNARIWRYSLQQSADVAAKIVGWSRGRAQLQLHIGGQQQMVRLPVVGAAMAQNAVAAAAVAAALGLEVEEICQGLAAVKPLNVQGQGRMVVEEYDGVTVINDAYNANPVSMRAALETLLQLPVPGRRFAVLGDMLELGAEALEAHLAVLRFAAQHNITVWGVGELFAQAFAHLPQISGAACTLAECSALLERAVRTGDAVLFKGSRAIGVEQILAAWRKRKG